MARLQLQSKESGGRFIRLSFWHKPVQSANLCRPSWSPLRMAAPPKEKPSRKSASAAPDGHQPYVPDDVVMPEFTWQAVLVGAVLGIVFAASSLYLVLKVGITVS